MSMAGQRVRILVQVAVGKWRDYIYCQRNQTFLANQGLLSLANVRLDKLILRNCLRNSCGNLWFVHKVKWRIWQKGLHLEKGRRGKYVWDCKVWLLCEPKRQWPLHTQIMSGRASGKRNLFRTELCICEQHLTGSISLLLTASVWSACFISCSH